MTTTAEGIVPQYQTGPVTFTVLASAVVTAGQMVDPGAGGTIQAAGAGSNVCLGVATTTAVGASVSQATTVPDVPVSVNLMPLPPYTAVANRGVYPVTFAATATFGQRLICAASGQVTPAGATPDARQVVGICYSPGGVTSGNVGLILLRIG
jgi:hypothetical protein